MGSTNVPSWASTSHSLPGPGMFFLTFPSHHLFTYHAGSLRSTLTTRYNLFIILYPIGASSEAFLSLSTLPPLSTLTLDSVLSSLNPLTICLKYLPQPMRAKLIKTRIGKHALWSMARASVGKKGQGWGMMEVARLVLFFVWWPGTSILARMERGKTDE
jgi:hypothetical protein